MVSVHLSVHPKYLSSFFSTCTFLYIGMKLFFFHFRDLRARLELAINKTLELAQKQEEEPQDDQSEFGSDSEEVRAQVKL